MIYIFLNVKVATNFKESISSNQGITMIRKLYISALLLSTAFIKPSDGKSTEPSDVTLATPATATSKPLAPGAQPGTFATTQLARQFGGQASKKKKKQQRPPRAPHNLETVSIPLGVGNARATSSYSALVLDNREDQKQLAADFPLATQDQFAQLQKEQLSAAKSLGKFLAKTSDSGTISAINTLYQHAQQHLPGGVIPEEVAFASAAQLRKMLIVNAGNLATIIATLQKRQANIAQVLKTIQSDTPEVPQDPMAFVKELIATADKEKRQAEERRIGSLKPHTGPTSTNAE